METPTAVPSVAARLSANVPLVLAILLLVDSLHFVFARLLLPYLPPITSAFLVLAVATVETAVFMGMRRSIQPRVLWQHGRFFAAVGLLVAAATALSYSSVRFIDPAAASLLAQTSILFALGFSIWWLGERLTRLELLGAAIAILGVFVVTFQSGGGSNLLIGTIVVLAAAFVYALHTAVVKQWGQGIEFSNFFLFRVGSTTFFLLLFVLVQGEWETPPQQAWLYLLLAGTFDVVISRVLYYLALRRLQMSYHAIILTLSPVITVMWSYILFGTLPTIQGLVGGTAVIMGISIVTYGRRKTQTQRAVTG